MSRCEIKSRIVANNILPIFVFGFIIINMDKLKKSLKHLFAPAIVLLLVAIMGVFSPVVSVAAALRLQIASVQGSSDCAISNLPARTVKVGTSIEKDKLPSITSGTGYVTMLHAGQEVAVNYSNDYTYGEIGQYEWRFYEGTANGDHTLFNSYTVSVTDTTYTMSMPSNVVTVAPKGLTLLELPLPASYTVGGESMEIDTVAPSTTTDHFAAVTLADKKGKKTNYRLSAIVSLENNTFAADKVTYGTETITIDLAGHTTSTGTLKVTYLLSDTNDKILVALPLTDITIKDVNKSDVTFANIPTAPSVANLAYYSNVALTAPTADSAKVGETTFSVEAQTKIVKVQAYLFATEPSKWSGANVHTLTVENGVVKEGNNVSDLVEIDGLNVKIKALGWYRFQFETTTLFGYKLDDDFKNVDAIEQDSNKTYVRYWSDSVKIYRDSVEPDFAWVDEYTIEKDTDGKVTGYNAGNKNYDEDFSDYIDDYDAYLPMTEKPDTSTSKKITVNYTQGLTLPAIFPHDNGSTFVDMVDNITNVWIEQIEDANGKSVSSNYVQKGETSTSTSFKYDPSKQLKIKFTADGIGSGVQSENNEVVLKQSAGLYRVRISVEEEQPVFKGDGKKYSGGYAQTKTKYLYFYLASDADYKCDNSGTNSPVVDENKVFQVSDVYLWEGRTFDFPAPSFGDAHTSNDNLQVDYYLVHHGDHGNGVNNEVVAKLNYTKNASRITVDLDNLTKEDGTPVNIDSYISIDANAFYIYAVARNFNGMQANLRNANATGIDATYSYFNPALFSVTTLDQDEVAQYGYAWKRAKFAFHDINTANTATVTVGDINAANTEFVAGKTVKIPSLKTKWSGSAIVDGQMSFAVYLVKDNKLKAYDIYNSDDEVVSTVAFKRNEYQIDNLSFIPGVSGDYILVVTAKDHASNKTTTHIEKINVGRSGTITPRPKDTDTTNHSKTPDKTISVGNSLTLPGYDLDDNGTALYVANNRELFDANNATVGNYTITLLGVNDPNCITGNKFTPTKGDCTYTFRYSFYDMSLPASKQLVATADYVVQVNSANSSTQIVMGEAYNTDKLMMADVNDTQADSNSEYTVGTETYHVGANGTGTEEKPAFAITLDQFKLANYGASNNFVLDSASLYQYLEPIYKAPETGDTSAKKNIAGYMYPAIAIPMANIVSDMASSDEVEITVQKSGSSNYLVSSKKLNAGNSNNTASVAGRIGDYFVFRPTGKFSTACKETGHDAQNYLETANSASEACGVYTVTYKTSTASVSYNITVGNLANGEINWKSGFLTYDDNKEITSASDKLIIDKDSNGHRYVTIDMRKVFFTGNDDMSALIAQGPNGDINNTNGFNPEDAETAYYWKNVSVTVSFEDGSFIDNGAWSEDAEETAKIKNKNDYTYKFDLTQGSGTYKVTIKLWNNYTSSYVTKSIDFTLDAESTNKNVNLNTVWGVILIVLSVGLLAGVIFYFVKTARATRFVDAPRAIKGKDKKANQKDEHKIVATPKDVEAPKDDVK